VTNSSSNLAKTAPSIDDPIVEQRETAISALIIAFARRLLNNPGAGVFRVSSNLRNEQVRVLIRLNAYFS